MRNLAWSVLIVGLTSSAALAQVPAQGGLASAPITPAAAAALTIDAPKPAAVAADDQAAAPAPPPPPAPPPKRATLTAGADFPTAYMFRGIFQEDEGFIFEPWVDLGLALYSGDGALTAINANVGNWNSVHSGPSGDELHDSAYYEADFYGSVTFAFGKFKPGLLFTDYTSPNDAFGSVKELAAVVQFDDSGTKFPLNPKAILAFELDGQADGGSNEGTYLELGVRPTIKFGTSAASLAIPVKMGLSLSDYYEGPTGSNGFGYFDLGGIIGVTLPSTGKVGWEIHGGVDFLWLGDNLQILNHDDSFKPVGTIGFSITY
jgi:hypothetical protein